MKKYLALLLLLSLTLVPVHARLTSAQLAANAAQLEAMNAALLAATTNTAARSSRPHSASRTSLLSTSTAERSYSYTLENLGTTDAPQLLQCSNLAFIVNCPTNVQTYLLHTTNLLTPWKVVNDVTNGETIDFTLDPNTEDFFRLVTEANMYCFELLASPSSEPPYEVDITKGWQLNRNGWFNPVTNSPLTGWFYSVYRDAYVVCWYPTIVTNETTPWPFAHVFCSVPNGSGGYVTYSNTLYMPTNSYNQVFHPGYTLQSLVTQPGQDTNIASIIVATNGFIYYQPTLPIETPDVCSDTNCLVPPPYGGPAVHIMDSPSLAVTPVLGEFPCWADWTMSTPGETPHDQIRRLLNDDNANPPPRQQPHAPPPPERETGGPGGGMDPWKAYRKP